jgi:hypothetical protein
MNLKVIFRTSLHLINLLLPPMRCVVLYLRIFSRVCVEVLVTVPDIQKRIFLLISYFIIFSHILSYSFFFFLVVIYIYTVTNTRTVTK